MGPCWAPGLGQSGSPARIEATNSRSSSLMSLRNFGLSGIASDGTIFSSATRRRARSRMAVPSIIGERHYRLAGAGDNGPAVTPDMLELCGGLLLTLKPGEALTVVHRGYLQHSGLLGYIRSSGSRATIWSHGRSESEGNISTGPAARSSFSRRRRWLLMPPIPTAGHRQAIPRLTWIPAGEDICSDEKSADPPARSLHR